MVTTMSCRPNTPRRPLPAFGARSPGGQRGMMLLEVLIAVMVFSIGILGIVGLQAASIRHVNDAQYRGEAIFLANALVSQMWADDRTATNPTYLDATYGDSGSGSGYAAFKEMARRLPGTELSGNAPAIKVAPGPTPTSSVVTVTVFWQLPGEQSAHNFSTSAVIGRNP
jgi:type IV pilus assembly protein PilV